MHAGLAAWLRRFLPAPMAGGMHDRVRSAVGALAGLLVTGFICTHIAGGQPVPLLIAPMGASAVLLFAVPSSPLAQPWSIMGGNISAALIGVTCARLLPDPLIAAALAAGLAVAAGLFLRCLHPPAGAIALTTVLGGPAVTAAGYDFVLVPVALNSAVLLGMALIYNNLSRRPYPHAQLPQPNVHRTADPRPSERIGLRAGDIDAVMAQYGEVLDISRDDLEELIQRAGQRAYRRRFGEIVCADIMSREVIAVPASAALATAWALMRRHDIRMLPVIDPARRVIGSIADTAFLDDTPPTRLRSLLGRRGTVADVMLRHVRTVPMTLPIVELVPLMADAGLRSVAVTAADGSLAGVISQADLVGALYRGGLMEAEA